MPDGAPIIIVDHLRHVYPMGAVVALDDVCLAVGRGEVVGLIGQNGSGKTTLAKHLNGLLKPTSGRVVVDDIDTTNKSVQELAAHVGYVFQNPNHQLFAQTVAEDLAFGPRNLGLSPAEVTTRVEDAISLFGLEAVRQLHPYRISFPMRKLVGIASVYTMRPDVLVLDEPTTGQDHVTTQIVNALIRQLHGMGITVVCVSHDMPLLASVAERLLVMWNGHLIADDVPRAVFANAAIMRQTNLEPPQITSIALELAKSVSLPVALSVTELADAVAPPLGANSPASLAP